MMTRRRGFTSALSPATSSAAWTAAGGLYRWLFNALHSFDFQLLLKYRPAWDIVVWLLSILGTIVSISGVVIGWRYLRG